jgi:hypothetical protein
MMYFLRFRRFALLLLSLTLSVQAMAVTSFGACHRVKALLSTTPLTVYAHAQHPSGSSVTTTEDRVNHGHAHHGNAAHDTESNDTSSAENIRVKCAACAGCHLCSAVLLAENVLADIPKTGLTVFMEFTVPRVRNVASGLDRPPRA